MRGGSLSYTTTWLLEDSPMFFDILIDRAEDAGENESYDICTSLGLSSNLLGGHFLHVDGSSKF